MTTIKTFLMAGVAAAFPIICAAQPAGTPAESPRPERATGADSSATIKMLMHELEQALPMAATNAAAAAAVRDLKLELTKALLARPQSDPPLPALNAIVPVAPSSAEVVGTNTTPTATRVVSGVASVPADPALAEPAATNAAIPAVATENTTNGLMMNFKHAPLDLVLNNLVEAAGFVVDRQADVRGTIDISSKGPVTKDEAVDLLDSNLRKNGYYIERSGRILTIRLNDEAKLHSPIQAYNSSRPVEDSGEVVTEIIPVRYANVSQLMNNLQILLPTSATLTANESANSLILVATKTDIHRMLEIINALDTSLASVSSIRVFPLRYEDSKDLATLITQLFTPQSNGQNGGGGGGFRGGGFFNMFRGGGGGFPGGGGPGGGGGGTGTSSGAQSAHVVAVGDDRSNSLIVSAPPDLLNTIAEMVEKVDQPVADITELRVFSLKYADVTELATEISSLYPDDTSSGSTTPNGPFPFIFRGGFGGNQRNAANSPDERARKMGKVVAVPEPRTKRLMVTAAKSVMPQIAEMVEELDVKGQQEIVGVYDLQNADPWDVSEALQDLFNRTTVHMTTSQNSSRSLMGQNNPLNQRATQTQPTLNSSTSFGTTGASGTGTLR